jgi:hypothetical protein
MGSGKVPLAEELDVVLSHDQFAAHQGFALRWGIEVEDSLAGKEVFLAEELLQAEAIFKLVAPQYKEDSISCG